MGGLRNDGIWSPSGRRHRVGAVPEPLSVSSEKRSLRIGGGQEPAHRRRLARFRAAGAAPEGDDQRWTSRSRARGITLASALRILALLATVSAPAASSAPAADPRVSLLSGGQVIQILDQTVEWYRALGTQQQNATQPSDLLILFANRQTADKVVALAFDMARANASC